MNYTVPLKQNHIFRRLYAKGESAVGRFVVVYARRNGSDTNRLGITTGVKLGRAVDRNRARRRIRETYRLNETRLKPGCDIVIVARSAAIDGDFTELGKSFLRCCKKLRLLKEDTPSVVAADPSGHGAKRCPTDLAAGVGGHYKGEEEQA